MATARCKKCNSLVAADAKVCHICGAKMRCTSLLVKVLSVGIACLFLTTCYSVMSGHQRAPQTPEQIAALQQEKVKKAEEKRQTDIASAAEAAERSKQDRIQSRIWSSKDAVTKILRDPDSAKFGKVVYRDPGIVCGFVNAKNGFGGYTGEKSFISLGTPDLTWLEGQSKDFRKIWNERCANK